MIRIRGLVLKGGKLFPKRRHKFNARKVKLDGYTFDSLQERDRYATLRQMEQAKQIVELRVHPLFPLTANGKTIGNYEADFSYRMEVPVGPGEIGEPRGRNSGGNIVYCAVRLIVEDVKAIQTDLFRWKRKHFEAEYPHCEFRLFDVKDGKMKRWTEADLEDFKSRVQGAGHQ